MCGPLCVLALAAAAGGRTGGLDAAHRLRVAWGVGTLVRTVFPIGSGTRRICVLEADRDVLDAVNYPDHGASPRLGLSRQSSIWYLLCVFKQGMALDESGICRVMRFAGRRKFACCFPRFGGQLDWVQVQCHDDVALPYSVPYKFCMAPHLGKHRHHALPHAVSHEFCMARYPGECDHQALPPRNNVHPVKFDLVAIRAEELLLGAHDVGSG